MYNGAALPEACKSGLRNVWSRSEGAAVNCERSELLTDERPPSDDKTDVRFVISDLDYPFLGIFYKK